MALVRRWVGAAALAAGAVICGCQPAAQTVSTVPAAPATPAQVAKSAPPATASPPAAILWRRTVGAIAMTPLRGTVEVTHFGARGRVRSQSRFEAIEGVGGNRYRLTFAAPESEKGAVVVSDGHTVWRYAPQTRTVARHAEADTPPPAECEEGVAASPLQADAARPEIEGQGERVAGRTVSVLALRGVRSGQIIERRWIDTVSGRTLRMEQYGPGARLLRRVEVSRVAFPDPLPLADAHNPLFQPDFPDATLNDTRPAPLRHLSEAEAAARRVAMPLHVRGWALRSATRTPPPADAAPPTPDVSPATIATTAGATHLLYHNGERTISVFVTRPENEGHPAALVPGAGWNPLTLDTARPGFTQETSDGAAVAWAGETGSRYVVIGRMPLAELLPVAEAFAAGRDDAPGTVVASGAAGAKKNNEK